MAIDNSLQENESPLLNEPADMIPPVLLPVVKRTTGRWIWIVFPILTFFFGLGGGYLVWGQAPVREKASLTSLRDQVNPKQGFSLPVKYGKVGPQLIENGVIDESAFLAVYEQAGKPLTLEQKEILEQGSRAIVVINEQNAYFLLNYFWALGLANKNPVLDSGALMQNSDGQVDRFASTGGWTIGKKGVKELYSAFPMLTLTAEQQARLEEAAQAVYRPCCDNPTHFPDCNHGMAMLGLFELMASQDASVAYMLDAAKHVNAFWFPEQTLEQGQYFKNSLGQNYKNVDARTVVGAQYSSGSGFRQVHQWLAGKGLLPEGPNSGGSCGV